MAKKKTTDNFQPFTHANIEIKNELLALARKAKSLGQQAEVENYLASVLIYSSLAEYLAENLLTNLTHFIRTSSYNSFGGILFVEKITSREGKLNLGTLITELKKFNFPDKENILDCFEKICIARNRLFHDLAKSDTESLTNMFSKDLPDIQNRCEEVISRINTIYGGLGKIFIPSTGQETK